MTNLSLDITNLQTFVSDEQLAGNLPRLKQIHQDILDKKTPGSEMLGWVDLPVNYDRQELDSIKKAAVAIQKQSSVLVVIGIGGSHLGAQAALEVLRGSYYNQLQPETPEIYFAGHNLCADEWQTVAKIIGDRDFSLNVISKSGTTLEPALAFGYFQDLLVKKYGADEANKRIYVTTDKAQGLLHDQALERGWSRFVVPDDVGGRYSVLTAVGLLPLAVAGINLDDLFTGAVTARQDLTTTTSFDNPAWLYAASRYCLLQAGYNLESLVTFNSRLNSLVAWWQQLFAESEGKTDKVIFPTGMHFTRDLHSLGQYLQQGQKFIFETTLWLDHEPADQQVVLDETSWQKWPYLKTQTINDVQKQAHLGTVTAHVAGQVPNLILHLEKIDEKHLGYLFYFFEFACALSALLLEVNPFDQDGVQAYKDEMMRRLQQ
ncbi:glucose-6-phosphate isomerase [bacterium]|nr:glucose-6-phosphate isomerase [bacterium]